MVERTTGKCANADCNQDREHKMIVISRKADGSAKVFCDPCLVPLVAALDEAGLKPVASCCGHHRRPGSVLLADGRAVILASNREWLQFEASFPQNINEGYVCRRCFQLMDDPECAEGCRDFACPASEDARDWFATPEAK